LSSLIAAFKICCTQRAVKHECMDILANGLQLDIFDGNINMSRERREEERGDGITPFEVRMSPTVDEVPGFSLRGTWISQWEQKNHTLL
jgi:hypothetical protein